MKINLILVLFLLTINCNDISKSIVIDDFSEKQSFSIVPKEGEPYYGLYVYVKGNVNDTCIVKYELHSTKLIGVVDTLLSTEYYGFGQEADVIFDPYKATKGELKMKVSIKSSNLF